MPDHQNLFIHIKECYDIAILRTIRDLENSIKKMCRSKEHLTFLHRCKEKGITPKCLKVKVLVKTKMGERIAKQCEHKFLQAAISDHYVRIPYLDRNIKAMEEYVSQVLDSSTFLILKKHLQIVYENTIKKTKQVLIKKLKILSNGNVRKEQVEKKAWVINQSSRILLTPELNLLSKGLNYATSRKNINLPEFIAPIEEAISTLPNTVAEQIRQETSQILKHHKAPRDNLTIEEKKIIKSLKEDKSIIILPADKGKATVILNSCDYHTKIMDLLNDTSTYKKVECDPTQTTQTRMNNMLLSLKKAKRLDEKTYYHLHCSSGIIPRFYGLPKVHKDNTPLRPIVAYYTSPTYNLAKHLNKILSPYNKNEYSIKTSTEFVSRIKKLKINEDEIMVSFDVISLFTSIPIKVACLEIETMLKNDTQLGERTKLSIDDIIRLLNLCLNSTSVIYNDEIYAQQFGTAMGSPISPLIANCVMSKIETEALNTFTPCPRFWCRFMDDTFCIINKHGYKNFLDHLNNMNPYITFTMEKETSKRLHFLDVMISRKNNKFTTTVYRKETNTEQYINFYSNHPDSQKASSIKALFKRSSEINNSKINKIKEDKKISDIFINNDYPESFINLQKHQKPYNNIKNKKFKRYVCIPFMDETSQKIKRVLSRYDIGTSFKPGKTLKNILCHPKNRIDKMDQSNIIYSIPCLDCPKNYIGQTSKQLKHRIEEHKKNVTRGQIKSSAVADHAHKQNHQINWKESRPLHQNTSLKQRLVLESWEHSQNNTFEKNKTQKLPDTYRTLISKPTIAFS